MPDLRGYGESRAPAGGDHGQGYSKREMANELVELMITFGSNRFAVVGGRGVAFSAWRLAHPISRRPIARVDQKTLEMFDRAMTAGYASLARAGAP